MHFVDEPTERKKTKAEKTATERRMEKKKKLKELFDNEYDMKGDNEFYDSWKQANEEQAKVCVYVHVYMHTCICLYYKTIFKSK